MKNNFKKRATAIVALSLSALMALSACSSSPADNSTTSPTTISSSTPSQNPVADASTAKQSPFLDDKDLPPVKDRIPENPIKPVELTTDFVDIKAGKFGGTMRTVTSALDWDADVFVANVEGLILSSNREGKDFHPNLVQSFEVNDDQTEYTFKLLKGLKWSDGEPVTMDDFKFTYENVLLNTELTPVMPTRYKAGGTAEGEPMVMEFIDDKTFKIKFASSYGGFLAQLSAASWAGYTDLLKPSHYLKPFHKDMSEYDEAKVKETAKANGVGEDAQMWVNVFNLKDNTHWELTKKEGIGFPKLYPWLLTETTDSVYTYERNPYYSKIDENGQQLPYFDKIQSTVVQDMEMVTMSTLAGEVDLCRESAALSNMPMYKENEKNGFKTLMGIITNNPTDILINMTYEDETFRLVTRDLKFRQALNYALDKQEICDTIYYGMAAPNTIMDTEFNVDKANKLLDEIGMDKRDSKGMRLAPNGKPFNFIIEVGAESPYIVPVSELVVEFWRNIGVDVSMKRIETSLVANKEAANKMQCRVIWTSASVNWFNTEEWGTNMWGRSWEIWRKQATETTITNEDGTTETIKLKGDEPPQEVKDFYKLIDSLLVIAPSEVEKTQQALKDSMKENLWYFMPVEKVSQPFIANAKMGNVPNKPFDTANLNAGAEQLYYE